MLCIDGPAGSGKTTLADAVVSGFDKLDQRGAATAHVVHMDDLFEGWSGLDAVDAQLETVLRPLAENRPGQLPPLRLVRRRLGRVRRGLALPAPGRGRGGERLATLRRRADLLVWVEAPYDERLHRGLARDGEAFAPHWQQWAEDETALFAREQTRERADLRIDGSVPYDIS